MAEKMTQYDRVKEITDQLEAGIAELFQSDQYMQWLTTMSRFHDYSLNNTILIAMQKPDATLVAGYTAWQKQFGRQVNKGEKGIRILAPTPYKQKVEVDKTDPNTGEILKNPDGTNQKETKEILHPAFKVVSVFDVSQTDGRELPSLGVNELTGDVAEFEMFFEALKRTCPVPMEFEEINGNAKGYYHQTERRIAIQKDMSQVQTVKTAIHEMAHQKLHAIDPTKKKSDQELEELTRNGKEVEAESVAYTVCQHYGIDTSDYSFSYIAGWSHGKETPELKASLNTIRKAASEMINEIDKHMQELVAEKEALQEKGNVIGAKEKEAKGKEVKEKEAGDKSDLDSLVRDSTDSLEKSQDMKSADLNKEKIIADAPNEIPRNPERHLTDSDIKNLRCIRSEYFPHAGESEHELTCEIEGKEVHLNYSTSRHDDGYSYGIHSEGIGQDIWDLMPKSELDKLEYRINNAIEYHSFIQQIEKAETAENAMNVHYALMEKENSTLSRKQCGEIESALSAKKLEVGKEAAFQLGDKYLEIHEASDGSWDFTFYGSNFGEMDGGQIGEPGSFNLKQAADEVCKFYNISPDKLSEIDRDMLASLTELYDPTKSDAHMSFMGEIVRQGFDPQAYWVNGEVMNLTALNLTQEMVNDIKYKVKIDAIPKMLFTSEQWHEIEKGIKDHFDVTIYADPAFSVEQMQEIRSGLNTEYHGYNTHEDVLSIADPSKSPDQMKQELKELWKQHKEEKKQMETGQPVPTENGTYRYYSTQRPLSPGSYPKPNENQVTEIQNFDNRQPVEEGKLQAWGYVEYTAPLTTKEMQDYELKCVPALENRSLQNTETRDITAASRENTNLMEHEGTANPALKNTQQHSDNQMEHHPTESNLPQKSGAQAPEKRPKARKSVLADLRSKQAQISGATAPEKSQSKHQSKEME